VATIFSDDRGKTWQSGEIAVPNTDDWINPNETVAVELKNHSVMLNVRSESKAHRRLLLTSPDGATRWSKPRFDDALLEPICMAGMVRYEFGEESLLLFSNPHNLEGGRESVPEPGKSRARKNLSIKVSRDEGDTWPLNKLLEDGPSSYSDLAVTHSGTILCFYGAGSKLSFSGASLRLARFNLEWLKQP
jgi:sialidase-1